MTSSVVKLTYEDVLAQLDALIGPVEGGDSRARRRLHILRAATELFARQGYRKTSMDEVAQRAGVAKGTLYTYYATKNELLIAAVALEKREHMGEAMRMMDPTRSAAERLREWVMALLLMPTRMPLTAALLRGDQEMAAVMAEAPAEFGAQIEANRAEFLGGLIDEAARPHSWTPSELRDRAAVMAGLAYLSTHLQAEHVRGGVSMERFAEILADTLVAGLRSDGRSPHAKQAKQRGTEP
jgi:AcrR family transcriptional regulator